jgi:hypothetical protein
MSDLSLETIFVNWAPPAPDPQDQVELLLDQIAQLPEVPEPSTPQAPTRALALSPAPEADTTPHTTPHTTPGATTILAGTTWSRADDDILPTRRFRRNRRTAA